MWYPCHAALGLQPRMKRLGMQVMFVFCTAMSTLKLLATIIGRTGELQDELKGNPLPFILQ